MRTLLRTVLSAVLTLALAVPPLAAQQTGSIGGQVTDAATGEPIVGAQVVIVGTQRGTLTNAEGNFVFVNVPAGERTIRVINLGYGSAAETVTVQPGQTVRANFQLETAAVNLDEIVVTATGEQRSRQIANSVGTLDAEEITTIAPVSNLMETLQGRVAGVNIQGGAGGVGIAQSIRIRGTSSISLSNTPIIIVDGARVENDQAESPGVGGQTASRILDFNPEDIERIEVVKGPAASALYGTAAASGVIRITTRQGRAGAPQFTLRSEYGRNTSDFVPESNVINVGQVFGFGKDTLYTTNLWERTNPLSDGDIETLAGSVRGGTEQMRYFVSGEYQHAEGTLPNNHTDRYYGRANVTLRPRDDVDIQVNAGYTSNFVALPDNDNNGFGYIGVAQIDFPWVSAVTAVDPNAPNSAPIETCPLARELSRVTGVPMADLRGQCEDNFDAGFGGRTFKDIATLLNRSDTERFTGSVTLTYRPMDNWSNRFTVGYDGIAQREHALTPVDPDRPFGSSSEGVRDIENDIRRNLSLDYVGTFNTDVAADLTSETSLGVQYFREVQEEANSFGQTFPSGATTVGNAVTTEGGEVYNEEKTLGFFGQQQFGWRDRLFLTGGIRYDDNSAFGQNLEGTTYPSAGVSYIVSEEPWFPAVEFVDDLKLRVAWGRSGRQPGSNSALQTFFTTSAQFRGENLLAVTPGNPGNFDLKPETSEEWEMGADFGLLDGRLGGEITYYTQTTEDALVIKPLAPSSGFGSAQWVNVGQMENSGWEFSLNALALDRPNFTWDFNLNFSSNDNLVTDLAEPIRTGFADFPQRHIEGYPFGSWIFPDLFIDENGDVAVTRYEPGDPECTAPDGSTLDPCPTRDVLLGQGTPTREIGLASTFTLFDNLSIYAFFDYKAGHHQFNNTKEFRCNLLMICPGAWETDAEGEFTDEAKLIRYAVSNGYAAPFIEEADFVKLRTVSVRYQLPSEWAQQIGAGGASLTFSGQNLATWTDYSGPDPEVNGFGTAVEDQTDFLTMPLEKRFLLTFEVNF